MLARVQRFYGGSPVEWYYRTPIAILLTYAEALPTIQSGEMLNSAASVALGSGSLDKNTARNISDDLQKSSDKYSKTPAIPAKPDALESAGITVELVDS